MGLGQHHSARRPLCAGARRPSSVQGGGDRDVHFGADRDRRQRSRTSAAALDRAEQWTFAHLPKVRRATGDTMYNCWTHMYAIQALVRMLGRKADEPDRRQKIMALMQHQIGMLDRYELVDGGWAYYDFNAQTKSPAARRSVSSRPRDWWPCTRPARPARMCRSG